MRLWKSGPIRSIKLLNKRTTLWVLPIEAESKFAPFCPAQSLKRDCIF
jgi:hypothetical protein